ncbi:MAG: DUF2142 domain-containing protein [Rhodospirillales bacterium]|nr:DUF2142 domain-containing protein [Rhodospirillales bacterium]
MLLCLLASILGALPMVVLTPPFQVPDEPQHFDRAFQISEGIILAGLANGKAGGRLPASLPSLTRRFLGTDRTLAHRTISPQPISHTMQALALPLAPRRRTFVDFTGAAFYAPFAYMPQALGIAVGRWLGAGPLMLLYLARTANALAAIAILSAAIGLLPVGQGLALLGGLLPMALYEYASVSPDALVISLGFLLTAVGLRALLRGTWRPAEVAVAALAGLAVCSIKPVYAPLLLVSAPAALVKDQRRNHLLALAVILVVGLGGTALWFNLVSRLVMTNQPHADVHAQLLLVLGHPLAFVRAMAAAAHRYFWFYLYSLIGDLGWLNVLLPRLVYLLAGVGLVLGYAACGAKTIRIPAIVPIWCTLLLAGAIVLVMLSMYLDATPVGAPAVTGVQGRYFLPLLALVASILGSLPPARIGQRLGAALLAAVAGIVMLDAAIAMARICTVFRVL